VIQRFLPVRFVCDPDPMSGQVVRVLA
jgi:hypothetical protein